METRVEIPFPVGAEESWLWSCGCLADKSWLLLLLLTGGWRRVLPLSLRAKALQPCVGGLVVRCCKRRVGRRYRRLGGSEALAEPGKSFFSFFC